MNHKGKMGGLKSHQGFHWVMEKDSRERFSDSYPTLLSCIGTGPLKSLPRVTKVVDASDNWLG